MNDMFEKRVRSAAVAGWWTLLVAVIFLVIQWIAYSNISRDINWVGIRNVWFWMIAVFKLCVWLMALVVIWLTLWARQLRKQAI
jgi:hypothetical protein